MTGKNQQIVMIGICAGDRDLIEQWTGEGRLPHIGRLLKEGLTVPTQGLPGHYAGAHWPSFITGCSPATNRVHSWEQIRPGTYEMYRCKAGEQIRRPQFWDLLSAAGKRVCVLDVPHSRITGPLNGVQVIEWGAHDSAYGFQTSPRALSRDILARHGRHPVSGHSDADRTLEELDAFGDTLVRGAQMKGRLSEDFIQREKWDFFAQVFTEAHCGGHLLWHTHDPAHPAHEAARDAGIGDRLRDIYEAIDDGIGRILAHVDEDAMVMLVANHGIGPKYAPQFMIQDILLAMGVSVPAERRQPAPSLSDRIDPYVTRTWQSLPDSLRQILQPVRNRLRSVEYAEVVPPPKINRAASLCFPVQNNTAHGGIRVNLKGREPNGQVAPGAEYEEFLDRLSREFLSIVNCDTGRPIVRQVYRADDLYQGPERDHLPDLMIDWANDEPLTAISSNSMGRLTVDNSLCRTGDHRPGGMVVVRGPGIRPGVLDRTHTCIDFSPTICALLGVDLPDVDGTAVPELLDAALADA